MRTRKKNMKREEEKSEGKKQKDGNKQMREI